MAQHIQFTMIIFFINLLITFMFPQYTFIENNVYQEDQYGNPVVNEDFMSSVTGGIAGDKSLAVSSFGILDALLLVWDFIKYILGFVLALPVLIYLLPVASAIKLTFFFPVLLMYAFAIIGFIRRS